MSRNDFAFHYSILLLSDANSEGLLAFLQDVRTAISMKRLLLEGVTAVILTMSYTLASTGSRSCHVTI